MKPLVFYTLISLVLTTHAFAQSSDHDEQVAMMLNTYCQECHNAEDWAGGIAFDMMSTSNVHAAPETWEAAVRKLRGRLMPPPGSLQPEQVEIDTFIANMEYSLDGVDEGPSAGHVPIQRLSRTEYAIAVKGLLGVEINPVEFLPTEIEVDGFDNIAATLSVSPAFLAQYISAARYVADLAVGEAVPKLASATYAPTDNRQGNFKDGFPLGTRGGIKFQHNFSADGEYRFNILDLDIGLYPRAAETRHTVVLLVAGEEVFRESVGGMEDLDLVNREGAPGRAKLMERFSNIPVQVKAGVHDVVVTFIERSRALGVTWAGGDFAGFGGGGVAGGPRVLEGVQVVGPYNSTGLSLTASRELIFVCYPEAEAEELACAERIISNLARRAFRRSVTQSDLDSYMAFYKIGRQQEGGFDTGIEQVVAAVLASPDFMYRGISPTKDIGEAKMFTLNDLELATRLSFFLWSQGPDEELLALALDGKLDNEEVISSQIKRMLADPKASTLVSNFAMKWLNVDDLYAVDPTPGQFGAFNDQLRDNFSTEIELFLSSILLEDHSVLELMTAEHTYLNESLARHYGINSVYGPQFRRVKLENEARWGILGKSAVLLRTSYGDRTSPVLRGAWVLEKLMGTPPAPPPPNVETDLSVPEGQQATTLRARLEHHRANPSCNMCHGVIDPIGLAMENFTVTGQWRDFDAAAGAPIDASTVMPGGVAINGPIDLRNALLSHPDRFPQAMTEKLMMYGLGRELEYFDMPQVRAIVKEAEKEDYRFSSLILGIVNSDAFRLQALPHEYESGTVQVASVSPNE